MMIENRVKKFCTKFGIQKPVMNAPMAGVTTPAMVAAVSNAGGLGILAGDLMNATKLAQAIDEVRALTSAPFAVNLRVPAKRIDRKHETDVDQALDDLKQQLGLSLKLQPCRHPDFDSQFEVLVDKQVEIVCASFGGLREIYADKLKDLGVKTIGAATTLREAKVMRSADVDAIIVQGVEAGGPRLNFDSQTVVHWSGYSVLSDRPCVRHSSQLLRLAVSRLALKWQHHFLPERMQSCLEPHWCVPKRAVHIHCISRH